MNLKKSKNWDYFLKGLVHGFGQKLALFSSFYFRKIDQENLFHDIVKRTNALLDHNKRKLKKSKIEIFAKGLVHGFGQKLAIFSIVIFEAKWTKKMFFTIM